FFTKEFCREVLVWRNVKLPNVLPFLGFNEWLLAPSFCWLLPWREMAHADIRGVSYIS
ncbi:hypothetical protein F5146DRAFT_919457, partial [Armillaria mellea]